MTHHFYSPLPIPAVDAKGIARTLRRTLWAQYGGHGSVPKDVSAPLKMAFHLEGLTDAEKKQVYSHVQNVLRNLPLEHQAPLTLRRYMTQILVTADLQPDLTKEDLLAICNGFNGLLKAQTQLARNPGALCGFPFYTMRNLPCSCAPSESLWTITGYDKFTGASGILEWCTGPRDAVTVWELMSPFRERFDGLKIGAFEASMDSAQVLSVCA